MKSIVLVSMLFLASLANNIQSSQDCQIDHIHEGECVLTPWKEPSFCDLAPWACEWF